MSREVFDGMKESEREEERSGVEKFYYESEARTPRNAHTVSIICFGGMESKKMKEISEISSRAMVFVLSNGTDKNTHKSSCRIIASDSGERHKRNIL